MSGSTLSSIGFLGAFASLWLQTSSAAEPDINDPAAELASFKLPPGFQANLFASEKDGVMKPIQIRWDARGRLWVIQSTDLSAAQAGRGAER